jgi:hypothetical protein
VLSPCRSTGTNRSSALSAGRTLFRESVLEKEYFGYVIKGGLWLNPSALLHAPGLGISLVVEPHPAPVAHSECFTEPLYSQIEIGPHWMSLGFLKAVHPSTFLTQPPLQEINVSYKRGLICWNEKLFRCARGLTFGSLLLAIEKVKDDFAYGHDVVEEQKEEKCRLRAMQTIASKMYVVKHARKAAPQATLSLAISARVPLSLL